MRFWSKGLGERELVIDITKGNVTTEEDKVCLRGVIQEPVAWNYEVTLVKEDVRGLLRIIFSITAISYFLRNSTGIFKFIYERFIMRRMGMRPSESAG